MMIMHGTKYVNTANDKYLCNYFLYVSSSNSCFKSVLLFDVVLAQRCGHDLCYNGTCVNNTCVCFNGYQGPTCFERSCTFCLTACGTRVMCMYTFLFPLMVCCRCPRVSEWWTLQQWILYLPTSIHWEEM